MSRANIVPGMGFSPDKMLQARLISYPDAHRYRLGVNYDSAPVNQAAHARCTPIIAMAPCASTATAVSVPTTSRTASAARQDPTYRRRPKFPVSGDVGTARSSRRQRRLYTQPGNLFRLMAADAKQRLIDNIVGSMKTVPQRIQELQVQHFFKADPAYGTGVAQGLGLNIDSLIDNKQATAAD